MAFVHGKATVVLGDDVALTGYLTQHTASKTVQIVDVTTYGSDDRVFLAGVEEGALSINGLFDAAASASDVELHSALGASTGKILTVGYGGLTIGNRTAMLQARETSYNINGSVQDAVRLAATFQADGGIDRGVALHDLTAETGTGNYSSVDNTASTANGSLAHLHVSAFTGTDCTIKVQHSTDDAIWSDLITFTTVSGVTQERSTSAGTVNRYVRAAITAGTFTSVTFAVSFARNLH